MPTPQSLFTHYQQALAQLEQWNNVAKIPKYGVRADPSRALGRFKMLLKLLGNPQQGPHVIYVGGTSGKGSVASMVAAMLTASGKRTGLYTSPHTTTAIERIAVDGSLIPPSSFAMLVHDVITAVERMERETPYGLPTTLEMYLAIGLCYFRDRQCEWMVIEVGMGGKWDASVVLPSPRVVALTTIDFDHMEFLGKNLTEITRHKAGIIKHGSHVWTMEHRACLRAMLERRTKTTGAIWHGLPQRKTLPALMMDGSHQQSNALLAQSIGQCLRLPTSAIARGITATRLPCRLETIQRHPRVVLDGAHNPQKIQSLAAAVSDVPARKLRILFAASENKDTVGMLKKLPAACEVMFTRTLVRERKCEDPMMLLQRFKALQHRNTTVRLSIDLDPWQALQALLKCLQPTETLLITGSLYLTGELRKHWIPEEEILKHRTSFPPHRSF